MRSTSSGVAWSPAMIAAGSPGAIYSRLNTNSATSSMTGMVARTRRSGSRTNLQAFFTSQNSGNGARTTPVTLSRQACFI